MKSENPPVLGLKLLSLFCREDHIEVVEGDLFELFDERVKEYGARKAKLLFVLDVILLVRPNIIKSIKNSNPNTMTTIIYYLKVSLRQMLKSKNIAFIHLLGLTLGLTSALFIFIYVKHELGFDKHITNSNNKFRIYNEKVTDDGNKSLVPIVPPMFAETLKNGFSEVKTAGRIFFDYDGTNFTINDEVFTETNGVFAEPEALYILDVEIVNGDIQQLQEPEKVLVSQTMFDKFFNEDFDNQSVLVRGKEYAIAGVYRDFPQQSHLKPDYIISLQTIANRNPRRMKSWTMSQFYTYVEFQDGVDIADFAKLFQTNVVEESKEFTSQHGYTYVPYFQNIFDIYLHSNEFTNDIVNRGNFIGIQLLVAAAIFLLSIAVLNFINLNTAHLIKRIKEIGIRKFVGASRFQIILQYIVNANLYFFISGALSVILYFLLLPYFSAFTNMKITIFGLINPLTLLIGIIGFLIMGIISGLVPVIVASKFRGDAVFLSALQHASKSSTSNFRSIKFVVGLQYALTIGLIILSIIVQDQFNFLQNKDLGFDKGNLIVMDLTPSMSNNIEATKEVFSNFEGIKDVTFSFGIPGELVANDGVVIPSVKEEKVSSRMFMVAPNYLSVLGMEIIAGRNFSSEFKTDEQEAFIINETAVKNFDLGTAQEAIGKDINWQVWSDGGWKEGKIIGVVKDFNFKSLHEGIENVVLHIDPINYSSMVLKVNPTNIASIISFIESEYNKDETNVPFNFHFVDQNFEQYYKSEQKLTTLFNLITALSIFTGLIGLYVMIQFGTQRKLKELSIRKVLGAGDGNLFSLLAKDYLVLVLISLFISVPIASYFGIQWLDNFAYHIDVSFLSLILVSLGIIALTILVVVAQSFTVVKSNPVENLRND